MDQSRNNAIPGSRPPGLGGPLAPASWWEWVYSIWHPDEHVYYTRAFSKTISPLTTAVLSDTIEITTTCFCYAIRHDFWKTLDGSVPGFPTRLKVLEGGELSWIGDSQTAVSSRIATGNTTLDYIFPIPREVNKGTQISIIVDNTLNAFTVTTDTSLWVIEIRRRTRAVQREL